MNKWKEKWEKLRPSTFLCTLSVATSFMYLFLLFFFSLCLFATTSRYGSVVMTHQENWAPTTNRKQLGKTKIQIIATDLCETEKHPCDRLRQIDSEKKYHAKRSVRFVSCFERPRWRQRHHTRRQHAKLYMFYSFSFCRWCPPAKFPFVNALVYGADWLRVVSVRYAAECAPLPILDSYSFCFNSCWLQQLNDDDDDDRMWYKYIGPSVCVCAVLAALHVGSYALLVIANTYAYGRTELPQPNNVTHAKNRIRSTKLNSIWWNIV